MISICQECFIFEEENEKKYVGSSHDEIAILNDIKSKKDIEIIERDHHKMQIQLNSEKVHIKIHGLIPFSSEKKCMSILIEYEGFYFVITKGADDIIQMKSIH